MATVSTRSTRTALAIALAIAQPPDLSRPLEIEAKGADVQSPMAQLREPAVVAGEREQLEHLLLDAACVVLPLGAAAAISAVGNHGANAGLPRPPPLAAWRVLPVTRASGRPVPSGRIGRRHHGQRRPQALLRPDLIWN